MSQVRSRWPEGPTGAEPRDAAEPITERQTRTEGHPVGRSTDIMAQPLRRGPRCPALGPVVPSGDVEPAERAEGGQILTTTFSAPHGRKSSLATQVS